MKNLSEIQKQLKMLEDESSLSERYNIEYKKKLSDEIKKFKPNEIKNTPIEEKKINLWERLLKTLGMI